MPALQHTTVYFPSCSELFLVSLHLINLQFNEKLTHEPFLLSKALKLLSSKKKPFQRMPLRICIHSVWSWCTQSIVVELRAAFECLSGAVTALFGGVTPKVAGFVYA